MKGGASWDRQGEKLEVRIQQTIPHRHFLRGLEVSTCQKGAAASYDASGKKQSRKLTVPARD